jgi:serine/threonine protein phosphatase PrpC
VPAWEHEPGRAAETRMSDGTEMTLPAVDVAERSDPGRDPAKQVNEDACGHRETRFGILAVVCDGMGGHVGGLEASSAALAAIFDAFEKAAPGSVPRDVLRDAIRLANVRVRTVVVSNTGGLRPGSTVVAVLVHAGGTEVAHVGDSRVLLVQQGQVFQLTRDHSMVQEMVAAKILTPEQAAAHPDANKITRALGIDDDVEVEVRAQAIAHVAGDAFVLCSDGLSDLVDPSEILQIVSSDPPAQAVGKLVDLANARGGHDNITVVIVRPRVSAPAVLQGAIAPTQVSTTLTLRPPAAPPFSRVSPVVSPPVSPLVSPLPGAFIPPAPASVPPSARVQRSTPRPVASGRARPRLAALVSVGALCLVVVAVVLLRASGRNGKKGAPLGANPPEIQLGTAPSASVDLTPADLPEPSVIDASGVSPLEPVPSSSVRHFRGRHSK